MTMTPDQTAPPHLPTSTQERVYPRTFKAWLGRTWFKLNGWTLVGDPPREGKYVVIAAPHTSNWDLIFMLGCAYMYDIKIHWFGKHTLFMFPFGGFMKWLGGIPINRSSPRGLVQQMIDEFSSRDALALAVPPSGTRSHRPYWKTGFYHIALGAGVPIATGFLDYERRIGGFGPPLMPTGDIEADFATLRAFYSHVKGKFPANASDVQLRREDHREDPDD